MSNKMLQLNPSLPVYVEGGEIFPTGQAEAIGWFDYGREGDLIWLVFMNETGEPWQVPNPYIRADRNLTLERPLGFARFKKDKKDE